MSIACSHLSIFFPLTQTKHRHGVLTKCSKSPLTKLWFLDRRKKGINLILNRDSDKQLENVFWTWGMPTLHPCPVLGTAYPTVRQPCPGLLGPQDGAGLLWVHSKADRDELVFSSPVSPKSMWLRWCHCALWPGDGWPWCATSGRTTANGGGQQKCCCWSRTSPCHTLQWEMWGDQHAVGHLFFHLLPRREGCFSLSCLVGQAVYFPLACWWYLLLFAYVLRLS